MRRRVQLQAWFVGAVILQCGCGSNAPTSTAGDDATTSSDGASGADAVAGDVATRPDGGGGTDAAIDAEVSDVPAEADAGSIDVHVSIDATKMTAVPANFAGVNSNQLLNAASFLDTKFQTICAELSPGWLRFPSGTADDAFDWSTGLVPSAWLTQFAYHPQYSVMTSAQKFTNGKGPLLLADFKTFADAVGGAHGIIVVNGMGDPGGATSASGLAKKVKSLGMTVDEWELTNEPYLFPKQFSGAADYVTKMQPLAAAITAVDASANIGLFYEGMWPGSDTVSSAWDDAMAGVTGTKRYWSAISTHVYPIPPSAGASSAADVQKILSGILAHGTGEYVSSYLLAKSTPTTPIYITELGAGGSTEAYNTWQFAGIFYAEYAARMSTTGNVKRLGVHAMYLGNSQNAGLVRAANDHEGQVITAGMSGAPIDTTTLDFGFYLSAPALDYGLAAKTINGAVGALDTTVVGGATVPISGFDGKDVPAVFAQAYLDAKGGHHLLITNKAGSSERVAVSLGGAPVTSALTVTSYAASDPTATNTPTTMGVTRTSGSATGSVEVGPWSVTVIDW
jgi:hypothetical protein